MTEQIEVTPRMNEYLKQLAKAGAQTTKDLALCFMVSVTSSSKMLKKLREAELVRSQKLKGAAGNVHIHELTASYNDLNIVVTTGGHGAGNSIHLQIKEEEILYAAILRNAGLIGQRHVAQFNKVYPERSKKCVLKQIVPAARGEKLCR